MKRFFKHELHAVFNHFLHIRRHVFIAFHAGLKISGACFGFVGGHPLKILGIALCKACH